MIKTLAIALGILAMAIPAEANPKGKGAGKRGEPNPGQKAARAELVVDSTLIEFLDSVEQAFAENEAVNETGPERRHALGESVRALPEKSRNLIALKYEQELPLKDIATKVGQSCNSVIKALVRLRQALAICVEKKLKLQEIGL